LSQSTGQAKEKVVFWGEGRERRSGVERGLVGESQTRECRIKGNEVSRRGVDAVKHAGIARKREKTIPREWGR